MKKDDVSIMIKNFNRNDWTVSNNILINNNNLHVTITRSKAPYPRVNDEILSISNWDEFFASYNTNQIVDVIISFNNNPVITYNWLYNNGAIIPLPIGANRINEFYQNEYDIAALLSDNQPLFKQLMNSSKTILKSY